MKDPMKLTEISAYALSSHLLPHVTHKKTWIKELAGLSPRLGNLLLRTLVDLQRKNLSQSTDCPLALFQNPLSKNGSKFSNVHIKITELDFHSCPFITDKSISTYLLSHEFVETIDLRDCNVTYQIFPLLTKHFPHLKILYLGQTEHKLQMIKTVNDFFPKNAIQSKFLLIKPKLRYLCLEGIYPTENTIDIVEEILAPSLKQSCEQIRVLDLSRNTALNSLAYIDSFRQVHSLVLYDVQPKIIEASIDAICRLTTLTVLDLSYNRRTPDAPNYTTPTMNLAKIARLLPKLRSLDISGTNLAGSFSFDEEEELTYFRKVLGIPAHETFPVRSSIAGLLLLRNELDFLGLFDTEERASARRWLPAKRITGEHTEEMLVTSLAQYSERPSVLTHIMAHLFRLYHHNSIQNPIEAGILVMNSMERHLFDRSLQTSGSACLYYVVDMFQNESSAMMEKHSEYLKRLLLAILQAMNTHLNHSAMIRNGLLTISRMQMHLPNHIMSAFEKTVDTLIRFIRLYFSDHVAHEPTLLHNGLSVLNHIACSVDGQEKLYMGYAGAIETAMGIIRSFLRKNINNEIVEIAWTLLWNITDETAENCRRFIEENNGLEAFLDCLKAWSDKRDLVRNMLGLLGNVAEVRELRPYLVTPSLMENFRILLKRPNQSDIEIPYNCGGVLANILSDGIEAWTIGSSIEQRIINEEMYESVQTWDLQKARTINYRSLSPILRLLNEKFPSGCVMWAVWAMTNLTTVHPEKYCVLVRNENGEPLLSQINKSEHVSDSIKNLAKLALRNVQRFYESPVPMEVGENNETEMG